MNARPTTRRDAAARRIRECIELSVFHAVRCGSAEKPLRLSPATARERRCPASTPSAAAASASTSVPTRLTSAARRRPRCSEQHRLDRHGAEGGVAAEQAGAERRQRPPGATASPSPMSTPSAKRSADVHDEDARAGTRAVPAPHDRGDRRGSRSPAPTPPATAAATISPRVHSADSGGSISPGHVARCAVR